jgi:hypothetical protein
LILILALIWWKRKRNALAKDKEMNVFKSSSRISSESEMMEASAPQSRGIKEAPGYDYSIKTPPHQRKSMSRSTNSTKPSFLFSVMTSEPFGLHLPVVGSSIGSEEQNI